MLKKLFIPVIVAVAAASIAGCNSKDDTEYTYNESSSVLVSSFSLQNDKKVLDSLSNVFFSIDLVNAKIFNADSLPYGTKVTKLVPNIGTPSGVRSVTLTYHSLETGRDSIVDFLNNSTDSINFSSGPVKLSIVSQSGAVTRDYEIKVNVHQVKADSLAWYSMDSAPLPEAFNNLKAQRAARLGSTFYLLSSDGTSYALSTTDTPDNPRWNTVEIAPGFTPRIETLRASDNALYILDTDGNLYSSTDAISWTPTGEKWQYIFGGYEDNIIGSTCPNGDWLVVTYPEGRSIKAPAGFPVMNTSLPAQYKLPMAYNTQMVMTGGRTADGTITSDSWAYDGNEWAKMTWKPIGFKLENITQVPYMLSQTPSSTWAPQSEPVLIAFGGRNESGAINRNVYYSRDWGMSWNKAPELMQLPPEFPTFCDGTAFSYSTTMYPQSRSSLWTSLELPGLQSGASFMYPATAASRAVAPIKQWECPAIYIFGGTDYNGNILNTLWRGVILQFTFEPVQ